jgi:chemotaxis signal transduction protein
MGSPVPTVPDRGQGPSGVHVHLRLGEERYALPVGEVLSIVDAEGVSPMIGAPPSVLGLRALDGQLLPVFRLGAVLGVAAGEPRRIVVVSHAGRSAGLAVDDVLDVAELAGASEEADSDRLRGSVLVDGTLVGEIDLAAVIGALEAELAT